MPADPHDGPDEIDTVEKFDRWVDAHAEDIMIGGGVDLVLSLRELTIKSPSEAAVWRRIFRVRWRTDRWFPALYAATAEALRGGRPVTYVGPCPHCKQEIRAAVRAGVPLTCPACLSELAGGAARPRGN